VQVYILILLRLSLLSVKLSINAGMSLFLNSHCLKLQELYVYTCIQGQAVFIVRTASTCARRNVVTFRQGTRAQGTNTCTADLYFCFFEGKGEFTQRRMVVSYRRFGKTYRSQLQGSCSSWKMESVLVYARFNFPFPGGCL